MIHLCRGGWDSLVMKMEVWNMAFTILFPAPPVIGLHVTVRAIFIYIMRYAQEPKTDQEAWTLMCPSAGRNIWVTTSLSIFIFLLFLKLATRDSIQPNWFCSCITQSHSTKFLSLPQSQSLLLTHTERPGPSGRPLHHHTGKHPQYTTQKEKAYVGRLGPVLCQRARGPDFSLDCCIPRVLLENQNWDNNINKWNNIYTSQLCSHVENKWMCKIEGILKLFSF